MKDRKKRQIPSALQDNVLSLIAILSVLALTLAVVFAMLWLLDRAEIVTFSDRFFPSETEDSGDDDDKTPSAHDILRAEAESEGEGAEDMEVTRFSGDFSTLYALLASSTPDLSYYAEYETTVGTGENALSYRILLLRNEGSFRIERYPLSDIKAIEHYVSDGQNVIYTDPHTKESATFPLDDAFFAEALAGIPSVASFCKDTEKVIDTAAYAEIDGEIVYYVRCHHLKEEGQESTIYEEYWISAERELVIRCRTYAKKDGADEDILLFSSETKVTRELTDSERATLTAIPTKTREAE